MAEKGGNTNLGLIAIAILAILVMTTPGWKTVLGIEGSESMVYLIVIVAVVAAMMFLAYKGE